MRRFTPHKASNMAIWMELGIFIVVLAFGFWQLWDVKKAKAERIAREQGDKKPPGKVAD
jgi:ABC-type nickel/cobalt efflux system permease component RcnA